MSNEIPGNYLLLVVEPTFDVTGCQFCCNCLLVKCKFEKPRRC